MTELTRLLDGSNDERTARALLRSADNDQPPRGSLLATAAALGISSAFAESAAAASSVGILGSGVAPGALAAGGTAPSAVAVGGTALGAASTTSAVTVAVLVKHIGIGMLTGALTMGGLSYAVDPGSPRASHGTAPVAAPAKPTNNDLRTPRAAGGVLAVPEASEPTAGIAETGPEADAPQAPAPAAKSAPAPKERERMSPPDEIRAGLEAPNPSPPLPTAGFALLPAPEAPAPAEPQPTPRPAVEPNRQLAAEVALLDRARQALAGGDAGTALSVLDEYSSRRRSGILDQETQLLRIRALLAAGDRAAAIQLARRFVSRHPESRHADSLRALTEATQHDP